MISALTFLFYFITYVNIGYLVTIADIESDWPSSSENKAHSLCKKPTGALNLVR